jgi:hypothetical protein
MWEPQPLTTLRAFKACRGENFTFLPYPIHFLQNTTLCVFRINPFQCFRQMKCKREQIELSQEEGIEILEEIYLKT